MPIVELPGVAYAALKEASENPYVVLHAKMDAAAIEALSALGLIEFNAVYGYFEVSLRGFEVACEMGFDAAWGIGFMRRQMERAA